MKSGRRDGFAFYPVQYQNPLLRVGIQRRITPAGSGQGPECREFCVAVEADSGSSRPVYAHAIKIIARPKHRFVGKRAVRQLPHNLRITQFGHSAQERIDVSHGSARGRDATSGSRPR